MLIGGPTVQKLTNTERLLVDAILAGQPFDPMGMLDREEDDPARKAPSRSSSRKVRAEVLVALLRGLPEVESQSDLSGVVEPDLVSVAGVVIVGDLNLRNLRGRMHECLPPLLLQYCRFGGKIDIRSAHLSQLSLRGSRFTEVLGEACHIRGQADFSDVASSEHASDVDNPLIDLELFDKAETNTRTRLRGPVINGRRLGLCTIDLRTGVVEGRVAAHNAMLCSRAPKATHAQLADEHKNWALNLGGATIDGPLHLDKQVRAIGGITLHSARIRGSVWLRGSMLRATTGSVALQAESIVVGGHFQLRPMPLENGGLAPFCCVGGLTLSGCNIAGELRVSGGDIVPVPKESSESSEVEHFEGIALWTSTIGRVQIGQEDSAELVVIGRMGATEATVKQSFHIGASAFLRSPKRILAPQRKTFTRETVGEAADVTLWLDNMRVAGDVSIVGVDDRPIQVCDGIMARRMEVEGGLTIRGLLVEQRTEGPPAVTPIDLSECKVGGTVRIGDPVLGDAGQVTCDDALILRDARIGGSLVIANVRLAPPLLLPNRPTLDANGVRVDGDLDLRCEVLGAVGLARAQIEGELKIGLRQDESTAQSEARFRLVWNDDVPLAQAYLVDLAEAQIRHSLQVGQIGVENIGAAEVRRRRNSVLKIRTTRTSFYPGWLLAELHISRPFLGSGRAHGIVSYLVDDADPAGTLRLLDGSSPVIHELNSAAASKAESANGATSVLDLSTSARAADYLRFFCASVWGEGGAFLIIESENQLPEGARDRLTRKPKPIRSRREGDNYRFENVFIVYDKYIFVSQFRVHRDGNVEMLGDDPILDLSDFPLTGYVKPIRFVGLQRGFGVEDENRDVIQAPGIIYEHLDEASPIYHAITARWLDEADTMRRPTRPYEVRLTGVAAGSLDDEDGEAWWSGWPRLEMPHATVIGRIGGFIIRLLRPLLWRPVQTLHDLGGRATANLLWLRLDGMRYGRTDRTSTPSVVQRDNAPFTQSSDNPQSSSAGAFGRASSRTTGPEATGPVRNVRNASASPGRNHPETVLQTRKSWLMLQYARDMYAGTTLGGPRSRLPTLNEYNPQPYEELAKALYSQGDFASSNEVLIFRSDTESWLHFRTGMWKHKIFAVLRALTLWPFSKGFGYGLKPFRAIATTILMLFIGWCGVEWANTGSPPFLGGLISDRPVMVVDAEPVAAAIGNGEGQRVAVVMLPPVFLDQLGSADAMGEVACGSEIDPMLYAIDVFIPLLDLRQESQCRISNNAWLWNWAKAFYAGLGWIVTSITILTVSGVLRRRVAD